MMTFLSQYLLVVLAGIIRAKEEAHLADPSLLLQQGHLQVQKTLESREQTIGVADVVAAEVDIIHTPDELMLFRSVTHYTGRNLSLGLVIFSRQLLQPSFISHYDLLFCFGLWT
jgi:hypothetical protein